MSNIHRNSVLYFCCAIKNNCWSCNVLVLGAVEEESTSVTGRKDSLSINLEFVKVSLSRMRRTGYPAFFDTSIASKTGKMDTTLINISGALTLSFCLVL